METLGRTHTASGIAAEVYRAVGFRVCSTLELVDLSSCQDVPEPTLTEVTSLKLRLAGPWQRHGAASSHERRRRKAQVRSASVLQQTSTLGAVPASRKFSC